MPGFEELDPVVSLADQMKSEEGPIVLINVFTVDPDEEDALVKAWGPRRRFHESTAGLHLDPVA